MLFVCIVMMMCARRHVVNQSFVLVAGLNETRTETTTTTTTKTLNFSMQYNIIQQSGRLLAAAGRSHDKLRILHAALGCSFHGD